MKMLKEKDTSQTVVVCVLCFFVLFFFNWVIFRINAMTFFLQKAEDVSVCVVLQICCSAN